MVEHIHICRMDGEGKRNNCAPGYRYIDIYLLIYLSSDVQTLLHGTFAVSSFLDLPPITLAVVSCPRPHMWCIVPIDPNACEAEGLETPGPRSRSPADRRVPAEAPPEVLLLVEQFVRG